MWQGAGPDARARDGAAWSRQAHWMTPATAARLVRAGAGSVMPGMKITLSAAMRARDVSRPDEAEEAAAREALGDLPLLRKASGQSGSSRHPGPPAQPAPSRQSGPPAQAAQSSPAGRSGRSGQDQAPGSAPGGGTARGGQAADRAAATAAPATVEAGGRPGSASVLDPGGR